MATLRQKELAKLIVKNASTKNKRLAKDLLVSAGYGVVTSEASPGRTIEQKGVQKELKLMGFTVENAKRVVSKIMDSEEEDSTPRLKAADMVFKVHGAYAAEKHLNLNVEVEASEEIKKGAQLLNELHRGTSVADDGTLPVTVGNQTQAEE